MSEHVPLEGGDLPLRARAEAAAWLATLGGPNRTPELEQRFGRWLSECEPHRIAWERVSDAWDLAGGLGSRMETSIDAPEGLPPRHTDGRRRRLALAAMAAVLLGSIATLALFLSRDRTVSTGTGERRVLSLEDGTRITLNTNTRVVVRYDHRTRRVRLEYGEALFEVKRAPTWPFIVTAGGREIRALGTAFEVRRYTEQRISITLVEGRIRIAPAGMGASVARQEVTVLASPGQRLTFAPHQLPKLDRPVLDQVIAWQSGEVVFDDTPLSTAAKEMNRYSERSIVIEDPQVAALRVSGLFQAGDSAEFAQGVAETFGLHVQERGDRMVLIRGNEPLPAHR